MLFNDLRDFSRSGISALVHSAEKLYIALGIDSITLLRTLSLPYINTAQAFKVSYLALGKAGEFCSLANTNIKLTFPTGRFIVHILQYFLEKVFHWLCSFFDET